MLSTLRDVIDRTEAAPTIVNPESTFVVVTYWWGRGNMNVNIARPCISHFESIVDRLKRVTLTALRLLFNLSSRLQAKSLVEITTKLESYNNLLDKCAHDYWSQLRQFCAAEPQTEQGILVCVERSKTAGRTPTDFEFRQKAEARRIFDLVFRRILTIAKVELIRLADIQHRAELLRRRRAVGGTWETGHNATIQELIRQKAATTAAFKAKMNAREPSPDADGMFHQKSVYDVLHAEFRYQSAKKYETMIAEWEGACALHRCNYLAVEYPEFARPGGYQMAINAKPMFIRKMQAICHPRAVLYIDGDMFIRQYPRIFDMPNVDFMARGWGIDPRSSYRFQESIVVDPYTFETSGGIMFFGQSPEALMLTDLWIREAEKPHQQGKADDRVLSMVFNSYRLMLRMTIFQLPVEYLWLTLDYDDRLAETLYDDDVAAMRKTIVVEHGECLTSEETAGSAGASSDRTPRFYEFIEAEIQPVSETVHEYIMFDSKEFADTCRPYIDFMNGVHYFADGNEELVDRGFVVSDDPEENAQPLTFVPYHRQFGNRNSVVQSNLKRSFAVNLSTLKRVDAVASAGQVVGGTHSPTGTLTDTIGTAPMTPTRRHRTVRGATRSSRHKSGQTVRIDEHTFGPPLPGAKDDFTAPTTYLVPPNRDAIPTILYLLSRGKQAIVPGTNETSGLRSTMIADPRYRRADLVFSEDPRRRKGRSLQPEIWFAEPVLFRPGNQVLAKFLSMFHTLAEFAGALLDGAYELVSRTRIEVVSRPLRATRTTAQSLTRQLVSGGRSVARTVRR